MAVGSKKPEKIQQGHYLDLLREAEKRRLLAQLQALIMAEELVEVWRRLGTGSMAVTSARPSVPGVI